MPVIDSREAGEAGPALNGKPGSIVRQELRQRARASKAEAEV